MMRKKFESEFARKEVNIKTIRRACVACNVCAPLAHWYYQYILKF
jgi:hypothetical protein